MFIEHGHYDRLMFRMRDALAMRANALTEALKRYIPSLAFTAPSGGSALWGHFTDGVRTAELLDIARAHGILVEPGEPFFLDSRDGGHHIRFGFSSIPVERIDAGIRELARLVTR